VLWQSSLYTLTYLLGMRSSATCVRRRISSSSGDCWHISTVFSVQLFKLGTTYGTTTSRFGDRTCRWQASELHSTGASPVPISAALSTAREAVDQWNSSKINEINVQNAKSVSSDSQFYIWHICYSCSAPMNQDLDVVVPLMESWWTERLFCWYYLANTQADGERLLANTASSLQQA